MGRKKSVLLTVLLTIVIVVLSVLTFAPKIPIPGTPDSFNPAILQYDLSLELGGGNYAYYYPEGVITETQYKNECSALDGEELEKYQDSYFNHKGLYLSKEGKYGIYTGDDTKPVAEDFKAEFDKATAEIVNRYKAKGYADYRVSVVDDYAIRVELPASEINASMAYNYLGKTGDISLEVGGTVVEELQSKTAKVSDLIKSISIGNRYKTSYIKIKLTDAGEEMIKRVKDTLSESTMANSSSQPATSLDITIGDETIISVYKDSIMSGDREIRVLGVEGEYKDQIEFIEILLNSAMENGGYELTFTTSDIRTFEPSYGKNTLLLLYIALGVILLAMLVLPVVKMGRFGWVSVLSSLSYVIVVGLCYAFISSSIFEISLGSIAIYLIGLAVLNVLQYQLYRGIKGELEQHKTAESSIKGGYRKTILGVVDVYVVLFLGALACLIGVAGTATFGTQALICVVAGAFINLVWARFINHVLVSANKDKYKYFRFVREDDDDE